MKKFHFSLDSVLRFKEQVLDSLKNEHARTLARVSKTEQELKELKDRHWENATRFNENKKNGATIMEMRSTEAYLQVLDRRIEMAAKELEILKAQEQEKRRLVIEANKETASIGRLREKKLEQYLKEVRKKEEIFMEEFVSNARLKPAQG
ncbi:flagellar export protein FliJ [Parasporobacterium paucivorans]|uniref:Flagellar FliJ protein n=1 Tax=Parasporobacterium paucivorans DSM 15970 TaxID=1122934 RepID=A0A1M6I7X3_9FIRM|nr:flagellar export protein FliJ [Parasporobacterium paucivorans]SHJ30559.1 flagellar FliJ protein [Parasporobacterium paucivorans DSM 15970]